jgi:formiminotetrahydrofolate cyclodeaminase
MLADKTLNELLDAFGSSSPTPGGGSASALAGAVAASLLTMVASLPKTKTGDAAERERLDAIRPALATLRATFVELIDRDAAAYDMVVDAYRKPKATDEEKTARKAAIQRAMRVATDVPLETSRAAMQLVSNGRVVAGCGNANANSDVGVALSLATTAWSGARMNVEINLGSVGDDAYQQSVRDELNRQLRDMAADAKASYEALGWKGHQPPQS